MRAYFGIKFHPDNRNRQVIEAISQTLASCDIETRCVRRDIERWGELSFSPQSLMAQTFDMIRSCDIALIELSEKGVGLGIEAGFAYAQGIPVVTIAREGSDISTTLAGISRHIALYRDPKDLEALFSGLRTAVDASDESQT